MYKFKAKITQKNLEHNFQWKKAASGLNIECDYVYVKKRET